VALQFLGHVFEYVLGATGRELNLLVATSGDTGSAAICGVRGRQGLRIFVMHPRGRVSRTQELQMTTVLDENVFNLAIEGTFDDCQRILKALFGDLAFRDRHALGAVNSINWARILAQIVYYFHAALRVQAQTGAPRVQFAVPTGNFGDIFAGFLACRMGLPVSRLILATNENDILARFFATGEYRVGPVHATISPSMDIQVASNFERYLYYRVGENPARAVERMAEFTATGRLRLEAPAGGGADGRIVAGTADTEATLATIRETHARHGYVLDPHTAVGVCVGRACRAPDEPLICLATAHPAKFSEAVRDATGEDLAHHPLLDRLLSLPTRCAALPASEAAVREYIQKHRVREFPCSP
jgi:threonine synthase